MGEFLPHPEIVEWSDVQQNFDAIDGHVLQSSLNLSDVGDAAAAIDNLGALDASENLADLASVAAALLNLGVARGQSSVTFSGSTASGATAVSHGLSGTPTSVIATMMAGAVPVTPFTFSYTSSQFSLSARATSSLTVTLAVAWIAVL